MRRALFAFLAMLCLSAAARAAQAASPRPRDLAELRKLRRELAQRRRRMIFNNDGDDVIYRRNDPTPEGLLAERQRNKIPSPSGCSGFVIDEGPVRYAQLFF